MARYMAAVYACGCPHYVREVPAGWSMYEAHLFTPALEPEVRAKAREVGGRVLVTDEEPKACSGVNCFRGRSDRIAADGWRTTL